MIHALNGSVVKSVTNLRADLENLAAETPVLQIERNGRFQYVTLME